MPDLGPITLNNLRTCTYFPKSFDWYQKALMGIAEISAYGSIYSGARIPIRVFRNHDTDDLGDKARISPRKKHEELEDWLYRAYGTESICIAIYGVNAWNDIIDDLVSSFVKNWISTIGGPLGGIDVYTFFGKYPITPFGIHKDPDHTFLFHLGPGKKIAWIWTPEIFEGDPVLSAGNFSLEFAASKATKYVLEPGDIIFIPVGFYHALANPEFSVTIGIAPHDISPEKFLAPVLENKLSEAYSSAAIIRINQDSYSQDFEQLFNLNVVTENITLTFKEEVRKEVLRLESTRFSKYGPPPRNIPASKQIFFSSGHHEIILDRGNGDEINLFARGFQYLIPNEIYQDALALSELLNKKATYEYAEFIKMPFKDKVQLELLLREFLKTGVLRCL